MDSYDNDWLFLDDDLFFYERHDKVETPQEDGDEDVDGVQ